METEDFGLGFLLGMKSLAKECRSRRRRCHYTAQHKIFALDFLERVEETGGTLEDAAELMSMHRATLEGWIEKATTPGRRWPEVNVNVEVNVR